MERGRIVGLQMVKPMSQAEWVARQGRLKAYSLTYQLEAESLATLAHSSALDNIQKAICAARRAGEEAPPYESVNVGVSRKGLVVQFASEFLEEDIVANIGMFVDQSVPTLSRKKPTVQIF